MKLLSMTLLLASLLAGPVNAAGTTEPATDDSQVQIQIVNDDETSTADMTDTEEETNNKIESIKQRILDKIDKKLAEQDLSDEEIEDLTDTLDDLQGMNINIGGMGEDSFMEMLIPMLAIVFIFGTPIMIVAAVLFTSYRKRRLMHDTIAQYVANGKDVPPEVMQSLESAASTPKSNLHKGLVMSGAGLGIFLCFMLIGSKAAALGLIPLFIGLAQLLIWKLENRESAGRE